MKSDSKTSEEFQRFAALVDRVLAVPPASAEALRKPPTPPKPKAVKRPS